MKASHYIILGSTFHEELFCTFSFHADTVNFYCKFGLKIVKLKTHKTQIEISSILTCLVRHASHHSFLAVVAVPWLGTATDLLEVAK